MCQNAWVKAACNTQSIQLAHLAAQHLTLEVGRVASGGAFRRLEGFAKMANQALDVVRLEYERAQFEATPALAALNVDLECSLQKLSPGAIPRAMGWRVAAVCMGRVCL